MLCVFKDHVNRLALEDHLIEGNDALMIDFTVELLVARAVDSPISLGWRSG